jgi:mono/diheme cytochrome c family protein
MRVPPRGTVSREERLDLPLLDWTNEDGTYKDATPNGLMVDATFVRHGKKKFEIVCATCHGITGDGRSIPGENMSLHPAPSLVALREKPVGYFFEVASHGFGLMPSFAGELNVRDRWAVATYIKALGYSRAVPVADLPPAEQQKLLAQPAQQPAPTGDIHGGNGEGHPQGHEEKKETL